MLSFAALYKLMFEHDNLVDNQTVCEYMEHFVQSSPMARVEYDGVSLDSRNIQPGQIFVAIKGIKTDGAEFALEAVKLGRSFVICEEVLPHVSINQQLIVASCSRALKIISDHKKIDGKRIAVTGSAGKTTLVNMLQYVLDKMGLKAYKSQASFNTYKYGVPVSVINCPADASVGIFEAGMSSKGEIGKCGKVIKPDISIITSIQPAHMANFVDLSAVADAKGEIIAQTKEIALVPGEYLGYYQEQAAIASQKKSNYDRYHRGDYEYRQDYENSYEQDDSYDGTRYDRADKLPEQKGCEIKPIASYKGKWENGKWEARCSINNKEVELSINHPNQALISGAMACLQVCDYLGLDLVEAARHITSFEPLSGRGSIKSLHMHGKEVVLIDESYNANIDAMINALDALRNLGCNSNIAVLGDVKELGDHTAQQHLRLRNNIHWLNKLIVTGDGMKTLVEGPHTRCPASTRSADPSTIRAVVVKVGSKTETAKESAEKSSDQLKTDYMTTEVSISDRDSAESLSGNVADGLAPAVEIDGDLVAPTTESHSAVEADKELAADKSATDAPMAAAVPEDAVKNDGPHSLHYWQVLGRDKDSYSQESAMVKEKAREQQAQKEEKAALREEKFREMDEERISGEGFVKYVIRKGLGQAIVNAKEYNPNDDAMQVEQSDFTPPNNVSYAHNLFDIFRQLSTAIEQAEGKVGILVKGSRAVKLEKVIEYINSFKD